MSWTLLLGLVLGLGLALFAALSRRNELARMRRAVDDRERAVRQGSDATQLLHPVVDLSRCLGCGTCVEVCPEENVLQLVHGQAVVVNGARCVGHSKCEAECPVGAITVTIANLEERRDIPAFDESLEAIGVPGLFLAGEVTAHALIKGAVDQGVAVGSEIALRVRQDGENGTTLDLCIVGAGPAGLACSLEAKRHGLQFVTLDQERGLGGTVAKYPRRKLVMSEPVEMPLFGRLGRSTYTKEELVELWKRIAREQELPLRHGEVFVGLERDDENRFVIRTEKNTYRARYVCLALGRRGTPRQLGVPGEELPKVAYSLLDAHSYQGRRVLVVGGGDTAVEAAMGLAEQPGNEVTLSYRKETFFRIRSKNERRLETCLEQGKIRVLYRSEVQAIRPDAVDLAIRNGNGSQTVALPNDEVFVMAGGVPPVQLLERSGVSFDASHREPPPDLSEQGTGLTQALAVGFLLSLAALIFAFVHLDYYWLPRAERPAHEKHHLLRPGMGIGLWLGITAVALVIANLVYLLRRSPKIRFNLGSLQAWMTSHVATGILAFLCATLHGAMSPRDTVGGHAFWALVVLLLTGAIGRYFYAYVPRAANGRELELMEVKVQLAQVSEEWDQGRRHFRECVRAETDALVHARQWSGSFLRRVLALLGVQRDLRRVLQRLRREGRTAGVPEDQIDATLSLARRAHRTALMAAHYEDLRAILSSWRYLHRWVALLMVVLVIVHIAHALIYGGYFADGGGTG